MVLTVRIVENAPMVSNERVAADARTTLLATIVDLESKRGRHARSGIGCKAKRTIVIVSALQSWSGVTCKTRHCLSCAAFSFSKSFNCCAPRLCAPRTQIPP
jgi:hypothetical protein